MAQVLFAIRPHVLKNNHIQMKFHQPDVTLLQMLAGLSQEERSQLGLEGFTVRDLLYLNMGDTRQVRKLESQSCNIFFFVTQNPSHNQGRGGRRRPFRRLEVQPSGPGDPLHGRGPGICLHPPAGQCRIRGRIRKS